MDPVRNVDPLPDMSTDAVWVAIAALATILIGAVLYVCVGKAMGGIVLVIAIILCAAAASLA